MNGNKILVVVESPGKISKIQSILGSNYLVVASVGHIIDLDPSHMSIDIENGFKPEYKPYPDKSKVITNLRTLAKSSSDILLAADEDREGEMIAWSIAYILKLKNPKRIIFNSITKTELLKAVKSPTQINNNVVDAQKVRRMLDRIVGYSISPLLRTNIGPGKLSAGRVQSVVVELIIDKENEIKKFMDGNGDVSFFKFKGSFYSKDGTDNNILTSTLHDLENITDEGIYTGNISKMPTKKSSVRFLEKCMKAEFRIANMFNKKSIRNPSTPFTTSTLQQEASRKFNFPVKKTMQVAQNLYEAGYITYMRTDSINLSKEALSSVRKYVIKTYGKKYHRHMVYKAKNSNTQEAHEAVRPTNINTVFPKTKGKIGNDEIKLYSLIWKRTVASQMKPAEYKVTSIQILISNDAFHYFLSTTEILMFEGYLKVYNIKNLEDDQDTVDNSGNSKYNFKIGEYLLAKEIVGTQEYKRPPLRYNEASLIDKLDPKNLNIGRPSTYATIINKILDRDYVKKSNIDGIKKESLTLSLLDGDTKIKQATKDIVLGKEVNKFVPTSLGLTINEFLVKEFSKIMDYKFTADMENHLDDIAEGKVKWSDIMQEFYNDFNKSVLQVMKNKKTVVDEKTRVLGKDPETGIEIIATIGKHTPVVKKQVSISKYIFAPIKEPLTLKTITLEQALKLFEYPKDIGKYKQKQIQLMKGQFGFYIKYGKDMKFPLPEGKEKDITCEEIIKMIKEREPLGKFNSNDKMYTILKGKGDYSDYIRVINLKQKGKQFNVPLPENTNVKELTVEKIQNIVKEHYNSKSNNKYNKYNKSKNTNANKSN